MWNPLKIYGIHAPILNANTLMYSTFRQQDCIHILKLSSKQELKESWIILRKLHYKRNNLKCFKKSWFSVSDENFFQRSSEHQKSQAGSCFSHTVQKMQANSLNEIKFSAFFRITDYTCPRMLQGTQNWSGSPGLVTLLLLHEVT